LRMKLPYEVALEKLLAARQFLSPEQAHTFSDLVSEVVRSFIEQTFPVRAEHRTTEEFLCDLVTNADGPLAGHRDTLGEFLGHCDLAKFAMWRLSIPQMEAMHQSARDFILATGQPVKARRPETRALGFRPAVIHYGLMAVVSVGILMTAVVQAAEGEMAQDIHPRDATSGTLLFKTESPSVLIIPLRQIKSPSLISAPPL